MSFYVISSRLISLFQGHVVCQNFTLTGARNFEALLSPATGETVRKARLEQTKYK